MKLSQFAYRGMYVNRVIQFLTYSDILMLSGWGLVTPILAVFVTDQIKGGNVEVAGLSVTIYFIIKSIGQIPVARFLDNRKGEGDDYWIMILGSLLLALSAFLYLFAELPWHVYAIQAVYGMGGALSYPSWYSIFTKHIDKNHEAWEWSVYTTATDVGSAMAAGLGGLIASDYGYDYLFVVVGVMTLLGTAFLAGVSGELKKR